MKLKVNVCQWFFNFYLGHENLFCVFFVLMFYFRLLYDGSTSYISNKQIFFLCGIFTNLYFCWWGKEGGARKWDKETELISFRQCISIVTSSSWSLITSTAPTSFFRIFFWSFHHQHNNANFDDFFINTAANVHLLLSSMIPFNAQNPPVPLGWKYYLHWILLYWFIL